MIIDRKDKHEWKWCSVILRILWLAVAASTLSSRNAKSRSDGNDLRNVLGACKDSVTEYLLIGRCSRHELLSYITRNMAFAASNLSLQNAESLSSVHDLTNVLGACIDSVTNIYSSPDVQGMYYYRL